MLFNTASFIFVFLPAALVSFFLAARFLGRAAAIGSLIVAAVVFYSAWEPWHLAVLAASVGANYLFAARIIGARQADRIRRARAWLILAVAANLALLGTFKYFDFLAGQIALATGTEPVRLGLSLPLGISFFTFTQITYLVDGFRGRAERAPLLRYVLFVTYFPHLVAGPILHHSEILPQFERPEPFRFAPVAFADGASLFLCGLAKKTLLADPLGVFAGYAFHGAAIGDEVSLFAAWGGALSFAFQIYFDFSGYSDMALGLARMMRIELPINFASPYRACSIAEFWRRWHMTLSRFLRDYVYIPLGGSRRGEPRRYLNLMITMLLGGLWHGAGWTFIVWGGLHGLFLVVERACAGRLRLPAWLGWALTFLAVTLGWVFFRAQDLDAAFAMLRGMAGLSGAILPDQVLGLAPGLERLVEGRPLVPHLADRSVLGFVSMIVLLAISFAVCLGFRNLYETSLARRIVIAGATLPFVINAVLFSVAPSQFIYFRF